jgi:hypothetical protein
MRSTPASGNAKRRMTAMPIRYSLADSRIIRMTAMPNRQALLRFFVAV